MSFLWRGSHKGAFIIKLGLGLFLGTLFIQITFWLLKIKILFISGLIIFSVVLWIIGKIIDGAQKRTRTSTKKNFTRT